MFPKRKQLLDPLRGKILEVGSGTGVNFPLYGSGVEVWAVEPSSDMLRYAKSKLAETSASIRLFPMTIEDFEMNENIPESGFDAVVCTLVLCTIPNPEAVIRQLYRWLKPGGQLVTLEHIQTPTGWRKNFFQLINPFWKYIGGGCDLTRPTNLYLKQADFIPDYENYFQAGLYFYEARLKKHL